MDAYVLGRHDGDLPTNLLGGEAGNRVRAMAQLDGPDHNAFYAIEGDDQAAVDAHVRSIIAAGTEAQHQLLATKGPGLNPEWVMGGGTHPSHMPPWELYLFWRLAHPGDPVEFKAVLEEVRALVGDDGIAVAIDDDGNALIEVGGNDQAQLAEAQGALEAHFGNNLSGGHAVTGAGIVKG